MPLVQDPSAQTSSMVQRSPSSQGPVLSTWPHPVCGSQISVVQTLSSSHPSGSEPVQVVPLHVSVVVQLLPSSHGPPVGTYVQPMGSWQPVPVQTLPSSHDGGGPPTHVPPLQVSLVVQGEPSLHGSVLATETQPSNGSQCSVVQISLSSQFGAGPPPTHAPPLHVSTGVHALLSLHGAELLT